MSRATSVAAVHENITDFFGSIADRTITVQSANGHPLLKVKAIHAAAVAAAGVILAPRLTAVAALGALVKGFSLNLDQAAPTSET